MALGANARGLHSNICTAVQLPADKVGIELIGVRASWVMEGGKVLPEPEAEGDWLKAGAAE